MEDIVIRNLSKSFDGKDVIRDFNAVIPKGRVTGLMAPSGAGKTTLLNILTGFCRADAGSVEGLSGLSLSAVFQEDRLCEGLTPDANIRLVNQELKKTEVQNALCSVGLSDCLDQPVRELSGGMRRRVALLRALMARYDLLLLDEPFKGLDKETKELVMADTKKRCKGRTVLLVTHDSGELDAMGAVNRLSLPLLQQAN